MYCDSLILDWFIPEQESLTKTKLRSIAYGKTAIAYLVG